MDDPPPISLVSSKPTDSGLHVQLHPLVLLTISDHITRHIARQQEGPIVGALLGQTQGREISIEFAFECPTTITDDDEQIIPHVWFEERVQQCRLSLFPLSLFTFHSFSVPSSSLNVDYK
jgi:COP9 signalosome complex subunit 6